MPSSIYCPFHESCGLEKFFVFVESLQRLARSGAGEAAQRGVLEDTAEDAAAEQFSWPGTLLPRIPAPESTLRRSLARALFVVCRGSCAQPAPRVLVTKRKRTPRAAPRPCGRRRPVHHPFRNFGARQRASARSRPCAALFAEARRAVSAPSARNEAKRGLQARRGRHLASMAFFRARVKGPTSGLTHAMLFPDACAGRKQQDERSW